MTRINIREYLKSLKTPSYQPIFTQDQKDEMLEAFTLYDKDGDGFINTKELGTVIRALGQALTVCEETDIVAQFAHEKCHEIDYVNFLKLMTIRYRIFDDDKQLRESFKKFDMEDNGYLEQEDLRKMLTTIGEPLTEEEVDDWLKDGIEFIEDGKVHYEDFATFMLSK